MSTTTTSANLPAYLSAAFKRTIGEAEALRRRPHVEYPGQQLAELPPALALEKRRIITQDAGAHRPHQELASQQALKATRGFQDDFQKYLNPYQSAVTKNIEKSGKRFFKDVVMPELDTRFVRLGQHGSSRHAKLAERAARNISNDVMDQQQQALHQGYQQAFQNFNADKERQLHLASLMNKLGISSQVSNLSQAQALGELGLEEQAQEQRRLSLAHERWKEKERDEMERLNTYMSLLQGVPYVPSTYRRTEMAQRPRSMHRQDWSNLGLGFGGRLLGSLLARGGTVKSKKPIFMR